MPIQKHKTRKVRSIATILEDILLELRKMNEIEIAEPKKEESLIQDGYITLIDDGTTKTSDLVRVIGNHWSYHPFDELDKFFPPSGKETRRKFKYIQESDPELKRLSANDCEEKGIKGITLREWLIFEKIWFEKNGTHLDETGWTICSGSRYPSGYVPDAYWYRGNQRAFLGRFDPAARVEYCGARSAVRV